MPSGPRSPYVAEVMARLPVRPASPFAAKRSRAVSAAGRLTSPKQSQFVGSPALETQAFRGHAVSTRRCWSPRRPVTGLPLGTVKAGALSPS
jgi:hypothetical protein